MILSEKFGCSTLDIVMLVPSSDATSLLECWLKGVKTRVEADAFAEHWDRQVIENQQIECEVLEEKLELCRYFRLGPCQRGQNCFWDHVTCPFGGNCSRDCPYGHAKRVKYGFNNNGRLGHRKGRELHCNVLSIC